MKNFLSILAFLCFAIGFSQTIAEMTAKGFTPVNFTSPNQPIEKLIDFSKTWANMNKYGADVSNVTENSLVITGFQPLAAYYYNVGVKYHYDLRYEIEVVFNADNTYTLTFNAKEFYANEVLTKTKVPDFFTPEGKLKDDFRDVKPSLESSVERILKSYRSFISN